MPCLGREAMTRPNLSRRRFVQGLATASVLGGWPLFPAGAKGQEGKMASRASVVRDRLWLWGHDAGSHNASWGLPKPSRITPVEAAFYLGVPNVIMVRYSGRPPLPLDQYAVPFRPLRQVVWSVVGAGGQTDPKER